MTARTELTARRYWGVAAALLAADAVLLAWNAWHYDWLRGYDAFANERYAEIVSTEYRLPSETESGVWHTPPLWFVLAGALGRMTTAIGWGHAQRPGQLLAAAAGLAVCVLVFLLARTLWPERRALHLVALVLTAASPALVRASAMYHPETLAVALATGGVLVAVRALRTRWTLGAGGRGGRAAGARLPDEGLGAAGARRGRRGRRSRRARPATLGSGRGALGRRVAAPRAVARQPAGRARERARVQPPAAGGLAAPPPAGELLRRPPFAARAASTRSRRSPATSSSRTCTPTGGATGR